MFDERPPTHTTGAKARPKHKPNHPEQGAEQAPLGKACENGGPLGCENTRRKGFRRQRQAAHILGKQRVGKCCWSVSGTTTGATFQATKGGEKVGIHGLQTCGSVWHCPVCSGRISEVRRREMNTALENARKQGLSVFLVTLTFRHSAGEPLAETLEALKVAAKSWREHRAFKRFRKAGLVGTIVATELTHGSNGWHPHLHILVFWEGGKAEGQAALEALREPWLASLAGRGRTGMGAAYDVQDGTQAGQYVAKWGAAEEMTLGNKKEGKRAGRSPFQLLDSAAFSRSDRALFFEYGLAVKGRRQLVWTRGLKDRFGVDDVSDEAAAEAVEDLPVPLLHLATKEWSKARVKGRANLCEAGERAGTKGIVEAIRDGPNIER